MAKKDSNQNDSPLSNEGAPSRPKRPWRKVLYWGSVVGVWFVILGFFFTLYLAHDLPDLDNLPEPGLEEQIRVLDNRGNVLTTYGANYGDTLTYDQIPPLMISALLAVEDRRFFEHGAIDWLGFLRAAFTNVTAGRIVQGGSTITQQLAKNIYLSHQRSWKRKAQEFFLAYYLESKFSKEEIITLYLNRVYFGSGAYGLDAAARRYFDHPGTRLSLQEAAVLAGLMKAPSRYAPTRDPVAAIERSHVVLTAMMQEQVITPEALDWAKRNTPKFADRTKGSNIRYFSDWIVERLRDLDIPLNGTVDVYTTLDANHQQAAERALVPAIDINREKHAITQGAILAMTPDGAVQAMMGGRNYGESQYNRATMAERQPGSAFKPFVYLAGLRAGLSPDLVMLDEPVNVDGYSPNNYDGQYHGAMTLAEAMARSINTIAVKVQEAAGRDNVATLAENFGLKGEIEPHASMALGTMQVRLIDLIKSYAVFAGGGRAVEPYGIVEVRSSGGQLLYRRSPLNDAETLITSREASTMTDMLQRVIEAGSGKIALLDRPGAGKTGTSQDSRDAWFAGFTADMVVGVWLGNDDNSPMKGITGGGLPAMIWRDYMIASHAGLPPRPLNLGHKAPTN